MSENYKFFDVQRTIRGQYEARNRALGPEGLAERRRESRHSQRRGRSVPAERQAQREPTPDPWVPR
eukprot:6991352-Lingulodinium_polyedra.AAC.1